MIKVLRLGHRAGRDDRISTHVGLTARQWGAEEIVYTGQKDKNMMQSVKDIVERWGGNFSVKYKENWKTQIKDFEGLKIHLTMYGTKIEHKMKELRAEYPEKDFMIIVGAEKVPRWVYKNVDYNISVGNQPHSEIAALAVFMDRLRDGEIKEDYKGAEIEVVPTEDRKITHNV